jgi:predicted ArsR family transcriptional regulator
MEGRAEEIFSSVQDGDYSIERAAEKLGITVEEVRRQMEESGYRIPETV